VTGLLIAVAAVLGTVLASSFMWWATKRSALWAMAAGAILALVALAGALIIAWVMTWAAFR
jgi:hypothetical protein